MLFLPCFSCILSNRANAEWELHELHNYPCFFFTLFLLVCICGEVNSLALRDIPLLCPASKLDKAVWSSSLTPQSFLLVFRIRGVCEKPAICAFPWPDFQDMWCPERVTRDNGAVQFPAWLVGLE